MKFVLKTGFEFEIVRVEMLKVKFVDFPDSSIRDYTLEILREEFQDVQESDEPDFLFYSVFGYEHLKYDCVRICWTGENIQPDFNICDYAIGFSYMEFEDRFKRIPLYYFYLPDYKKAREKHLLSDNEINEKVGFCNFIYSNGNACSEREEFFDLLSTYKTVDSGGKFRNNIGGPVESKYEFQKKYKFSIAFENSSTSGYTTEKILQAFSAGTIPIYWGNPNVGEDFNEKAFINCHKYKNFEEVLEVIKKIDQDDELFMQYLREPIGNEEKFPEYSLRDYRDFVIHICSQMPQMAIRRNNAYLGKYYQQNLLKLRFPKKISQTDLFIRRVKKLIKIIKSK